MENENIQLDEVKVSSALDARKKEAEELLRDPDKTEKFLQKVELHLKEIPKVGEWIADVPLLISMVRSYIRKEYKEPPLGIITCIVAALLYLVLPVDIIPDIIPIIGHIDDAAVVMFCMKQGHSDILKYVEWRDNHVKLL